MPRPSSGNKAQVGLEEALAHSEAPQLQGRRLPTSCTGEASWEARREPAGAGGCGPGWWAARSSLLRLTASGSPSAQEADGLVPHQGQGIMCQHLTAWVAPVTPAAPRGEPKTEAAASRPRQERPGDLGTPRHSRKEMGQGPGERSADPRPLPQGFCPRTSPHLTGPQTLLLSSRDPQAGEAGHRNGWTTLCQNPPEPKASISLPQGHRVPIKQRKQIDSFSIVERSDIFICLNNSLLVFNASLERSPLRPWAPPRALAVPAHTGGSEAAWVRGQRSLPCNWLLPTPPSVKRLPSLPHLGPVPPQQTTQ